MSESVTNCENLMHHHKEVPLEMTPWLETNNRSARHAPGALDSYGQSIVQMNDLIMQCVDSVVKKREQQLRAHCADGNAAAV